MPAVTLARSKDIGTQNGGGNNGHNMQFDRKRRGKKGIECHGVSIPVEVDALIVHLGDGFKRPCVKRENGYVSGGKLHLALRELQVFLRSVPLWLTFAAVVTLFAVSGPYGTSESMAFGPRLGYWLVLQAGAWAASILGVVLGVVFLDGLITSRLTRIFLGAMAANPVIGLEVLLINWSWHDRPPDWAEFVEHTLSAAPLTIVFCALAYLVMRGDFKILEAELKGHEPGASPARSTLAERLKPENRGTILHLAAEDHYTAVTTARGRELVLIRFSDALKELEAEDGLQVHRSHWVARAHVETLERDNGKLSLVLKGGTVVPVSRTFAPAVRKNWH